MRVLLAGPDYEENLSIRYLSSSLQAAGHETVLATFNSEADLDAVADTAEDVDIVGLSMCFQSRALEFLHLAREIKSRDPQKLIVAGGHYASCAAAELLEHHPELDIIVIHEGERTLVEIADAGVDLEGVMPKIAGIAYRQRDQVCFTAARRTLDDLNSLPFPDRCGPVHYIAGVPTSYLVGSRGCYGSCAYCCITTLHRMAPGKRFRQRRPELIADEMAALYHHRGTRQFVFHDDNFLVPSESLNHARITAFEKALKERGIETIALVIKCRPADTKLDVFRRLKQLGLVRVFLGIESATPRGLLSLERKQTVDDSVRALEVCAELDISAQFTIMTFNPDATEETLRSDITFMRQFRGNPLNFCRTEIYTGTPLEKRMIEVGRARGNYLARVYGMADPVTERACNIALDLFGTRCWSSNSLMQIAIGLDHTAAVAKRFYSGPERITVCDEVASWLRTVNLDTINLLEQVVDISASGASDDDPGLLRAIRDLKEHEAATRPLFLSEAMELRSRLQALRQTNSSQFQQLPGPRLVLAKQVAAAVLAVGVPTVSVVAQDSKSPSSAATADKKISALDALQAIANKTMSCEETSKSSNQTQVASLSGVVKDRTGVPVSSALVTITNADTNTSCMVKADKAGKYAAVGLVAGRYSVSADGLNFNTAVKSDVALTAGAHETVNFVLDMSERQGCCEYAPPPLKPPLEETVPPSTPTTPSKADQQNLTCTLSGKVVDAAGAVIADATITATELDTKRTQIVKTDQAGKYEMRDLAAGQYSVRVESKGFRVAERSGITLSHNSRDAIEFQLDAGVTETAAIPLELVTETASASSMIGVVTDQAGAAIANATVSIVNVDTKEVHGLTTNDKGEYVSTALPPGKYTLTIDAPGFRKYERKGVVLQQDSSIRVDVTMEVGAGVCEYVAAPLGSTWETPLWYKKKPFDYTVGTEEKDRHSIYGVAALVYGDWRHWIPIFEANRDIIKKPGAIPNGTTLVVPPEKHNIPKLASKVMPVYPAAAAKENVVGDVVLELAINNDGTIAAIDVIDGDPLLVDAATTAVKKWRFQPPTGNQKALFVIAISFSKDGKVRVQM